MTCWRRLAEWTEAGVWPRLHEVLLAELRSANALDFSRAAVDGSHIRAFKGAQDRTKPCRPGQDGKQAPPDHRRHRHPARRHPDRRQPQRRHATHPATRSGSTSAGQAWVVPAAAPPTSRPRASWPRSPTTPETTGAIRRLRRRSWPPSMPRWPGSAVGPRRPETAFSTGRRAWRGRRPRAEPAQPRRHSLCGAPAEWERPRGCGGAEDPGVAGVQPVQAACPGFRGGVRRAGRAERRASRSGAG